MRGVDALYETCKPPEDPAPGKSEPQQFTPEQIALIADAVVAKLQSAAPADQPNGSEVQPPDEDASEEGGENDSETD